MHLIARSPGSTEDHANVQILYSGANLELLGQGDLKPELGNEGNSQIKM
jgi:hypothetical protein